MYKNYLLFQNSGLTFIETACDLELVKIIKGKFFPVVPSELTGNFSEN
jgi:hypothetical protein